LIAPKFSRRVTSRVNTHALFFSVILRKRICFAFRVRTRLRMSVGSCCLSSDALSVSWFITVCGVVGFFISIDRIGAIALLLEGCGCGHAVITTGGRETFGRTSKLFGIVPFKSGFSFRASSLAISAAVFDKTDLLTVGNGSGRLAIVSLVVFAGTGLISLVTGGIGLGAMGIDGISVGRAGVLLRITEFFMPSVVRLPSIVFPFGNGLGVGLDAAAVTRVTSCAVVGR
jgi:hypothetical protein